VIAPFVLALALGAAEPVTLPLDPAAAASVASPAEVDPALAGSAAPEPALATSVAPTPPPNPPAAGPSLGGWP